MNTLSRVCILTSSLSLALSCYGEDPGQLKSGVLAPPAGSGVQLRLDVDVPPGAEREYCQFFQTGDEELLVNHDQVRFTDGTQYVVLWTTSYSQIPDGVREPFDCSTGVLNAWSITGLLAGSQRAFGLSALSLPEGVAVRLPARSVLLAEVRQTNASAERLHARADINLFTISASELKEEGGLLFWNNPYLKLPARDEIRMTASCPVTDDIVVVNSQSHMHARGVGYEAVLQDPDGSRRQIYANEHWKDVPVRQYDPELAIAKGSRIAWSCDYANGGDHVIYQGPRSGDEMCMFIASYYPRNDRIGYCESDDSFAARWTGAEWSIGRGSASCAQTLECVRAGIAKTAPERRTPMVTDCMSESSPAVESVLSRAVGCMAAHGEDTASACAAELEACRQQ
ncbi:MAG TPA: hypothetical protein VJV78_39740 [Polyangiales bacterium]|nr:hypothetical protein [Polyangiales bacterium]